MKVNILKYCLSLQPKGFQNVILFSVVIFLQISTARNERNKISEAECHTRDPFALNSSSIFCHTIQEHMRENASYLPC